MSTKPRIGILCSGRSALKSIQLLALENYLAGICVAAEDHEVAHMLEKLCADRNLPCTVISASDEVGKMSEWIKQAVPDAIFSIGFPYRVPGALLATVPDRFLNFHMGKLPQYRGPMPIFEALRAGESETEISIHLMSEEFDEGDIVLRESIAIQEDETFGSLAVKFADRISIAAQNIAQMLEFGSTLPRERQAEEESEYFPFPETDETSVRWHYMNAQEIVSLMQACNPWNHGADTILNGHAIKVVYASTGQRNHKQTPGTILDIVGDGPVTVACINNQVLHIHIASGEKGILPAGKLIGKLTNRGIIFG